MGFEFIVYGNNRNPGDKKMAKKEKMLFALKQSWLFYCGLKKERERDYTLTTGLYNPFER